MIRWLVFTLAAALWAASANAQFPAPGVSFHYDDLDRFEAALDVVDRGMDAETAFTAYLDGGTPALAAFAQRYAVTGQSLAEAFEARPNYYRSLPGLRETLREREDEIRAAIERLEDMAPTGRAVPIHFLVADQKAGGTPVLTRTEAGPRPAIAIALDMMGLNETTDLSEFPNGPGGRAGVADIPQVAVHETVHILQLQAQGGLENYRSIYNAETGSMLAIAVREGCADYLTFLASGWRLGDRHIYGSEHEAALWAAFDPVADEAPFSVPGWFGGTHPDYANWPSQIGYWLGFRICEAHHAAAGGSDAGLHALFSSYARPEIEAMADDYAHSLAAQ